MKIYENVPRFNEEIDQYPMLEEFLLPGENNGCIITCPGGAYWGLAGHERYVELFNEMGLSVFVLTYRCAPYHYPCQMLDIQRAIKFVRFNAKKFGIDPNKILVAGSSAGGHLAASACCHFETVEVLGDEIDKMSARPDGGVLCYPVISLTEFCHEDTANNFSGGDWDIREKYSIQKNVHKDMPPMFVWHTMEDQAVDVRNVLTLATACKEQGADIELHIFTKGWHGLGDAKDLPNVHQWVGLCKNCLETNKFI